RLGTSVTIILAIIPALNFSFCLFLSHLDYLYRSFVFDVTVFTNWGGFGVLFCVGGVGGGDEKMNMDKVMAVERNLWCCPYYMISTSGVFPLGSKARRPFQVPSPCSISNVILPSIE
ncbi:hypothetical protein BC829DRAFT_404572, partial [Chytridium lagenaria]